MESANLVICELKGNVNSNPDIIKSFPNLTLKEKQTKEALPKFLPFGAKAGDFFITAFSKYNILSYVFRIRNQDYRDDLVSLSALIKKRENPEIFKPILKAIIDDLDKNHLLNEDILRENLEIIFNGINSEEDITIEGYSIELSKLFAETKEKFMKPKLKLEGNFF